MTMDQMLAYDRIINSTSKSFSEVSVSHEYHFQHTIQPSLNGIYIIGSPKPNHIQKN